MKRVEQEHFSPLTVFSVPDLLVSTHPESKSHRSFAVFVHGLKGDAVASWGRLPELLFEERREIDVAMYGYPTALGRSLNPLARSFPFSEKAAEFAGHLQQLADELDVQSLHLVGHSLGGLLVWWTIKVLSESRSGALDRVRSVTTFGTPYGGSDRLSRSVMMIWLSSPDLRTLAASEEDLEELIAWLKANVDFKRHRVVGRRIGMRIVYSPIDHWVSRKSGIGPFGRDQLEVLSLPHSQLVKASDELDRRFYLLNSNVHDPDEVVLVSANRQSEWVPDPSPSAGYRILAAAMRTRCVSLTDAVPERLLRLPMPDLAFIVTPYHDQISNATVSALVDYVAKGGWLVMLGTYCNDVHHQSNFNALGAQFGIRFEDNLILPGSMPSEKLQAACREQALKVDQRYAAKLSIENGHALVTEVPDLSVQSACTLALGVSPRPWTVLARTNSECLILEPDYSASKASFISSFAVSQQSPRPVVAVRNFEDGTVVAVGGWKVFLNEFLAEAVGNARLLENIRREAIHGT